MCFRPAQVSMPIKCPSCGALNPFNVMVCKKCKTPLNNDLQMVKCPKCNRLNLLESGICDDCGLDFQEIQGMIQSGEIALEAVIVHADGSPIDWTTAQKPELSGTAASVQTVVSSAPKPPGPPPAPSAPKMPPAAPPRSPVSPKPSVPPGPPATF
jgi:uncharacterized OB-fold protein